MPISVPVVAISFVGPGGNLVPFTLQMYGIPLRDFLQIPSAAVPLVREAMRRRGYDPDEYITSPFMIREVFYGQPSGKPTYARVRREYQFE